MKPDSSNMQSNEPFAKAYFWWLDLLGAGEISRADLCLLIVLKRHCQSKTTCDPSATTLGKEIKGTSKTPLTRQWINNLLSALEKKGLLQLRHRKGRSHLIKLMEKGQPANSSLQVDDPNEVDLQTPLYRGCQLQFATPANSSLHKVDRDIDKSTSPSASISPRRKSPKSPPEEKGDSRIKQLIDYWCTTHEAKYGHKYKVSGAKDGKNFKDLLADYSTDVLKACIDLCFADDDPWLNGKRTIPIFRSRLNQYLQQTATRQTTPTPAAHRKLPDLQARPT